MLPTSEFQSYVKQHKLFNSSSKILLAVSGGKDSVLMAHLFKASNANFAIAHCNFNLRAEEAIRDEDFVKQLAKKLEVPIYVAHFETKKYAADCKISTQMAARDLRYTWFQEIRIKNGFDYIALAQHQNDAIETVLINLVRGTGISGLHGILPKREFLIRPLLFLNREEIEQIINEDRIDFVEDSSNASTNYIRNKLRHQVVPQLKEINPNLEQTFEKNISRFAELEYFLRNQVEMLTKKIFISKDDVIYIAIDEVKNLNPARLLLFELLKPYGFTESVIDDVLTSLEAQTGKRFLSSSHQITLNRSYLLLSKLSNKAKLPKSIVKETEFIEFGNQGINVKYTDKPGFDGDNNKAFVDADLLVYPLTIRAWQNGDRFIPLGMKTFKKLSDFFIDEKVPLVDKNQIPIIVNGNGDIVWITGHRSDNRYKITKATKKVAIFETNLLNGK